MYHKFPSRNPFFHVFDIQTNSLKKGAKQADLPLARRNGFHAFPVHIFIDSDLGTELGAYFSVFHTKIPHHQIIACGCEWEIHTKSKSKREREMSSSHTAKKTHFNPKTSRTNRYENHIKPKYT